MASSNASLSQEEVDFLAEAVLTEKIMSKGVNALDNFDSPIVDYLMGRTKEIGAPPTKDGVKFLVKGRTGQRIQWWDGADILTFGSPHSISAMVFGVGRGHMGIELLYQALEQNGIKVNYGKGVRENGAADSKTLHVVANILTEAFDNARIDWKHDMIRRFWRANTDQAKCFAGVDALFPASGNTTGDIGQRSRTNPIYRHNLVTGITKTNFQLSFHKLVKKANDYQHKGKVEIFAVGDDVWDVLVELFSGTDTSAGKFDYRSTRDLAMKKGEKYNVALPQDCFMYEDAIIFRAKEFDLTLAVEEPAASPSWQKRIYGFNPAHFGILPIMDQDMVNHGMPYNQRLERTSMHGEYVVWSDHPRANFVGVLA